MADRLPPASAGIVNGVLVDVIDLGEQETKWGTKPQEKWVFELDELKQNGERFIVTRKFNVSDHEMSTRRQAVERWLDRPLSENELMVGFDSQTMIDEPCQLRLVHVTKKDRTYTNIDEILPANGKRLEPSGTYVRWQEN